MKVINNWNAIAHKNLTGGKSGLPKQLSYNINH